MDSSHLLTARYMPPELPDDLVRRPRLTSLLDASLHYRMTLLCAPAGSGKTTLLGEWTAQNPHYAIAWLSLDSSDNDPVRFWTGMLYALARGQNFLIVKDYTSNNITQHHNNSRFKNEHNDEMLARSDDSAGTADLWVARVLQRASELVLPCVLILDGYQEITEQAIGIALGLLLRYLPGNIHIILACRAVPDLPLAQMRAQGQLYELYAPDLNFSLQETTHFLSHFSGITLTERDIHLLHSHTAGWITGLRLAGLSLTRQQNVSAFVATFSGDHPYLADYFSVELFLKLSTTLQDFLLSTSILEQLSGPLCNTLTGRDDGQGTLEHLASSNLFLVCSDTQRRWYCYQRLFRDFLRGTLQRMHPERVVELHQRAYQWFGQQERFSDAIEHALLAQDFSHACILIEHVVDDLVRRRELHTLIRWFTILPSAELQHSSYLCLIYCEILLTTGQVEAAERLLLTVDEDAASMGKITTLRTMITSAGGKLSAARALLTQDWPYALSTPEKQRAPLHTMTLAQGMTSALNGEIEAAQTTLQETSQHSLASGDLYTAFLAHCQQAAQHQAQGKLHLAAQAFQAAIQLGVPHQTESPMLDTGMAYVCLGEIQREWNQLDEALETIELGTRQSERSGNVGMQLVAYTGLAQIACAREERDRYQQAVQHIEQLLHKHQFSLLIVAPVIESLTRLALKQNAASERSRWDSYCQETEQITNQPDVIAAFLSLIRARRLLAQRDFEAALPLLKDLRGRCEARRYVGLLIPTLLLQVLALYRSQHVAQALPILARALALAEPEGYIRTFIDEGAPIADLLLKLGKAHNQKRIAAYPFSSRYVHQLLIASGVPSQHTTPQNAVPPHTVTSPLPFPLSTRELEILRLIAQGLNNQAIVDQLAVEMSTLKTHIKHIYRKLDATSRAQAIARAHALHLLETR